MRPEPLVQVVPAGPGAGADRAASFTLGEARILVVADGAGGMGGGPEAAEAVVAAVARVVDAGLLPASAETWAQLLHGVDRELAGAAHGGQSTAVVMAVGPGMLMGASVGDSVAVRIDAERVVELTADQVRKPLLGSGLARPVAFSAPPGGGRLLLCTDGLWQHAPQADLMACLRQGSLEEAARALVERVTLPSGERPDDVGLVLCSLEPDGASARAAAEMAAAYACDRRGQEAEAAVHYRAAYELGVPAEERAGFLLGYGSTLKNVGQLQESERILREAMSEFPEDRALPAFMALTLHAAGRSGEAIAGLIDLLLTLRHGSAELERYARALAEYRDELRGAK